MHNLSEYRTIVPFEFYVSKIPVIHKGAKANSVLHFSKNMYSFSSIFETLYAQIDDELNRKKLAKSGNVVRLFSKPEVDEDYTYKLENVLKNWDIPMLETLSKKRKEDIDKIETFLYNKLRLEIGGTKYIVKVSNGLLLTETIEMLMDSPNVDMRSNFRDTYYDPDLEMRELGPHRNVHFTLNEKGKIGKIPENVLEYILDNELRGSIGDIETAILIPPYDSMKTRSLIELLFSISKQNSNFFASIPEELFDISDLLAELSEEIQDNYYGEEAEGGYT